MGKILIIDKIILFSLLFFSTQTLWSQKTVDSSFIVCKYKITSYVDTLDTYSKYEELASLQIGSKVSLFKSIQKYISDSLSYISVKKSFNNASNGVIKINLTNIPKSLFNPEVFMKNGKVLIYDKLFRETYSYTPVNKCIWTTITKESKTINGYKCYKALGKYGKRDIVAWYTEEIPIPEGPYNYKGLPGLIIELYDIKGYNSFILQSLQKSKTPILPLYHNIIDTTFEKFNNKRKEIIADPVQYVKQYHNVEKNMEERVSRNMRKRNNFLD